MLAAATALRAASARAATSVPFHGEHQPGLATPQQGQMCFMAFDILAGEPAALVALLRAWSEAERLLTDGKPVAGDDGSAAELRPAPLTLTAGFGPRLSAPGRFALEGRRRRSSRAAAVQRRPA